MNTVIKQQPIRAKNTAMATYRIKLTPSHWIPLTGISLVGCESPEDARKKLHDELDRLIVSIEKGR